MLDRIATFKRLTPPLLLMLAMSFASEAHAAKVITWRKAPAKTVVVKKPAHTVKVKYVAPRRVNVVGVPRTHIVTVPRTRVYSGVRVVRPYGHSYVGFGYYTNDADAFAFLGLTALTLAILDNASEAQQRAHEQAFIQATALPAGETIIWNDGPASGTVSVVRTGNRPNEQPCREFQQTVTIGGNTEKAYGIACRQKDGAWRIVS